MLREGSKLIAYFGLIAPWASRRKMPLDEMAASIRKIIDDRFWSRLLRKYARRWREHLHIAFGDVRRDVSPYCSKNHVKQWDTRRKRSRAIMSRLELEDQVTGERMSLIEQIDKSVSNPEKRRVELMTRIGGFERVATESGYAGSFFTLTAHLNIMPIPRLDTVTTSGTEQAHAVQSGISIKYGNRFALN